MTSPYEVITFLIVGKPRYEGATIIYGVCSCRERYREDYQAFLIGRINKPPLLRNYECDLCNSINPVDLDPVDLEHDSKTLNFIEWLGLDKTGLARPEDLAATITCNLRLNGPITVYRRRWCAELLALCERADGCLISWE